MASYSAAGRQAGFTLLELVVAMAVLGIALGVLGMRGPARSPRLDAEAAARDLAAGLRLARSRAIAENRTVTVALGADAYSLDGEAPRPLPATVATADRRVLAFAGSGASSGGTVLLQAGGRQRLLRVDWLTGRVSLAEAR